MQCSKELPSVTANYQATPVSVREAFLDDGFTNESFVKGCVMVKTNNTGMKAAKDFQLVYSETCECSYLPKVIEEFKVKDLNDLMSKWDSLSIPRDKKTKNKYIEVVGSFLPIDYERVILGPNYSKFIERLVTHTETCHKAVLQEMKEDTTHKKSSSATKTRVSKKYITYLVEKKTAKPTMGHEPGHTSIATKYNRKM